MSAFGRSARTYDVGMASLDWTLEELWLVTADHALYEVVRRWTRGDLRDVSAPELSSGERTLLIATPAPWRSIVAVAQQRSGLLRPMLVVKNAIALWSLTDPPDDGPLLAESWPSLRHRFLIHNPGLSGVLQLLDRTIEPDKQR